MIAPPEVINPNRRIDQNHAAARRRAGALSAGCVPPNRASRCALSRWISASRPSCIRRLRSVTPVMRAACESKSSSILIVVRLMRPVTLCRKVDQMIASKLASFDVIWRQGVILNFSDALKLLQPGNA